MRSGLPWRLWVLAVWVSAGDVSANTVVLTFGDARPGQVTLSGDFGPAAPPVMTIPIPVAMPAAAVRDTVAQWLTMNTTLPIAPLDPASLVVKSVAPNAAVGVQPGNTAATDGVRTAGATGGSVNFSGLFDPFDAMHQPARFTAAIVTDVGTLTETLTAADLNFQTDGPIICQALFQRLAPRAPQYGAQINYAGDRLEVYFDPAYSIGPSGVQSGTTSPTPGAGGRVQVPLPPPAGVGRWRFSDTLEGVWGFSGPQTPPLLLPPGFAIPLPVPSTGPAKRESVLQWLQNQTPLAVTPVAQNAIQIDGIAPHQAISTRVGHTATTDRVSRPLAAAATIRFENVFDPIAPNGQPAVFTAGIVTDVGELTATVSAQELNFQTDGPIICQALFQRLAPRAPQFGAPINYAGDRLEVYFDPAYSIVQGGAVVGTTSRTAGASAAVGPPLPPNGNGDMNGDGRLDGADVQGLLDALHSPQTYYQRQPAGARWAGDLNGDGRVDLFDLPLFVARVLSGQG